jgi:phosphatidylinositol kinase/protein kinase (PI-3  family)
MHRKLFKVHKESTYLFHLTCLLGFYESISLSSEDSLQDTLRLLTLWFKFGAHDDVSQTMEACFNKVGVETWLEVIPQVNLLQPSPQSPALNVL